MPSPAAILGTKVGMTQIYSKEGQIIPCTVIKAGPCVVLQVKEAEASAGRARTDGYSAVQLGFDEKPLKRATLPEQGHALKAGTTPRRFVREHRLKQAATAKPGDTVTVEAFTNVGFVDVTGTGKGKGFQGVMKRHHFGGQCASHGTERKHRSPGSIGGMAPGAPGRGIKKGKRLPGHMGGKRITTRNHEILIIDTAENLLVIRGNIPGAAGGYVFIRESKTRPGPKPEPRKQEVSAKGKAVTKGKK